MIPALHPKLAHAYWLVELSNQLEKIAAAYANDPEVLTKALAVKCGVDAHAFGLVKEAANWPALKSALKPALKPLIWGTGIGVPLTLGGAHLINRFYDRSAEATSDVRNKVLQTALGLAIIGGGLYGLHRLTGGAPIGGRYSKSEKKIKTSSVLSEDAIEKLATVGVIEDMLANLPASTPESVIKLATEIRALNRGYGMRLLYEICHE